MLVEETVVAFCGILIEHTARALLDCANDIDGKVGMALEAFAIARDIFFTLRIHYLSRSYAADKLPKGRRRRRLFVDRFHFFGCRHETRFVAAFPKLIDGDVLQLKKLNLVTEKVQVLASFGVVPFALKRYI